MCNFRVELNAEDRAIDGPKRGDGDRVRRAEYLVAGRWSLYSVAVTHPDGRALATLESIEKIVRLQHHELRTAVFALFRSLDVSAAVLRDQLHAVADSEHRHAHVQ